jgi:predicted DNA-binding WGR domain protein
MTTRKFEFRDRKSQKFWHISRKGRSHTVRYGRIGVAGQEKTKEFDSSDKAKADHDKLIQQKLNKGYVEISGKKKTAAKKKPAAKETARRRGAKKSTPRTGTREVTPAKPLLDQSKRDLPVRWVYEGAYVMPVLPKSLKIDPILASLLHLHLFVAVSDEDTVDEDWALEAMEHVGHCLQSLLKKDALRIQEQLDRVAEHLRKQKEPDIAVDELADFLRNAGIDV